MPEGLRVLEAAGRKFGIQWQFDEFDWSCDYYAKHGRMMPEDALDRLNRHDAIFFGAAGWPAMVPDHISLWGLLIPFRRGYDQYVNLRPVRLMILSRDGQELLARVIAPEEATEAPQWTPDGGAVFVQTYPQDGRRIIAVDLASSQVLDLSQEHWDAYFALSPDGKTLLLNNGRGDFWLADVLRP